MLPVTYHPSPQLVVRVASLPLALLHDLRFARTSALSADLLATERWLHEQATPLSDALYPLIGAVEDAELRRDLIALRRAVFQMQPPKLKRRTEVWAVLPPELRTRLDTWQERLAAYQAGLAQGEALLEEEWEQRRDRLQQVVRAQPFQHGLILASADLYSDLRGWLRDYDEGRPRANRKLELGLMPYLSRAAAKTSPFSTFTSLAAGRWVEGGQDVELRARQLHQRSALQPSRLLLGQALAPLLLRPALRTTLRLHANTSLLEHGNSLHFVVWDRTEELRRVTATPALRRALELIASLPEPTYAALVAALAGGDEPARHAAAERYLEQLIAAGLIGLDLGVPKDAFDYLEQLLDRLAPHGDDPEIVAAAMRLEELRGLLARYAASRAAQERWEQLRRIGTTARALSPAAEVAPDEASDRNLFHEDALLPAFELRFGQAAWRGALDDLGRLQPLLALYDPFLPCRLVAAADFAARFGSGSSASLLDCYEATQPLCQSEDWQRLLRSTSLRQAERVVPEGLRNTPGLPELFALQRELPAWLGQQLGSDYTVQLDRELLGSLAGRLPQGALLPRATAFYCQALHEDGVHRLVLNALQSGVGRSLGRLQRLQTQAGGTPPASHFAGDAGEALPVDLVGVFSSSIALCVPQLSHEIPYPGYASSRPAEQQIPLRDLRVVHDPQAGRLRLFSARLGREILPQHPNIMGEAWLPPLFRFLLRVFGHGPVDPVPLSLIPMMPPTTAPGAGVTFYPRVALGRVTIERAQWVVPAEQFPARDKGERAFAYLLRLQRWRTEHGIPQICFLRLTGVDKYRKPLYLDFDSPLTMMSLDRASARATGFMLFQEALPAARHLLVGAGDQTFVSEYVIELTRDGAWQ